MRACAIVARLRSTRMPRHPGGSCCSSMTRLMRRSERMVSNKWVTSSSATTGILTDDEVCLCHDAPNHRADHEAVALRRRAAWRPGFRHWKSAIRGSGEPNGRSVFSSCRSLSQRTNHVPSGSGVATSWSWNAFRSPARSAGEVASASIRATDAEISRSAACTVARAKVSARASIDLCSSVAQWSANPAASAKPPTTHAAASARSRVRSLIAGPTSRSGAVSYAATWLIAGALAASRHPTTDRRAMRRCNQTATGALLPVALAGSTDQRTALRLPSDSGSSHAASPRLSGIWPMPRGSVAG